MISMNVESVEENITKPNLNDPIFWSKWQDECNRIEKESGWNVNLDVLAIDKLLATVAEDQIKIFKDHVLMTRKIRISVKNKAAANRVEIAGNNIRIEYEGDFNLYDYSDAFVNFLNIRKVRECALIDEDMAIIISL